MNIIAHSFETIFILIFHSRFYPYSTFQALNEKGKSIEGVRQWPFKAVARALEVIPRTLIQNCGGSTIRQLTALRAKHAQSSDNWTWGIDGTTGQLVIISYFFFSLS